jgi:spermidine synthase
VFLFLVSFFYIIQYHVYLIQDHQLFFNPEKTDRRAQMIAWENIGRIKIPGQEQEMTLQKRGEEFSIRTAGMELMNSRSHGSEDELARLTCKKLCRKPGLNILIGGLGMGFTLAAALGNTPADARVTVSELIPAVIQWNREFLGHLAGNPLDDPRVEVKPEDVAKTIRDRTSFWDAVLLDVDNGPEALTHKDNQKLYTRSGLKAFFGALRPGGILSVWSAGDNEAFTLQLRQCGFQTEKKTVRARNSQKGGRHILWLAQKPEKTIIA